MDPRFVICRHCGEGGTDPHGLDRLYGWIEYREIALTGYYQERTLHRVETFCSAEHLHEYLTQELSTETTE
jgi:hypothetical protein